MPSEDGRQFVRNSASRFGSRARGWKLSRRWVDHMLPSNPNALRLVSVQTGDRSVTRLKCSSSSESSGGNAESHEIDGTFVPPLMTRCRSVRQRLKQSGFVAFVSLM